MIELEFPVIPPRSIDVGNPIMGDPEDEVVV